MPTDRMLEELLAQAARALGRGEFATAIDAYTEALAIRSDLPDAWFNLGWAQRALRRFEAALDSYAKALEYDVTEPEAALVNRAAILSDHLFRPEQAIGELEMALVRNPAFVPAWLGLGTLHEDNGSAAEARAAYESALAVAPQDARSRARLAALDTLAGAPDTAAAALELALASARTAADRSELLFALGSAYDAAGRYEEAFAAIDEANTLARAIAPSHYNPAAVERLVDRLIVAFPEKASPVSAQPSAVRHVFICGMFRSGSTLVERMLSRHPAITAAGEREHIPALAQALPSYPDGIRALSASRIAALREDYVAEVAARGVVIDKRCDNFLHIGLILTLFPDAGIVHTVRQPLDNLLSIYFLPFGDGVSYDTDLFAAAHYYTQYRRLMAHWRRVFPGSIHDADYDTLVAEPASTLTATLNFLKLDWDPACLAPDGGSDAVRTASNWQVRQRLHTRSSGRWRHYRTELAEAAARLEAAGIDPSQP